MSETTTAAAAQNSVIVVVPSATTRTHMWHIVRVCWHAYLTLVCLLRFKNVFTRAWEVVVTHSFLSALYSRVLPFEWQTIIWHVANAVLIEEQQQQKH